MDNLNTRLAPDQSRLSLIGSSDADNLAVSVPREIISLFQRRKVEAQIVSGSCGALINGEK